MLICHNATAKKLHYPARYAWQPGQRNLHRRHPDKAPGRVGDASLIGCGCYADKQSAAVSCTGWGEPIMKLVLGKWAADRVQAGYTPELVSSDAIKYLKARLNGH